MSDKLEIDVEIVSNKHIDRKIEQAIQSGIEKSISGKSPGGGLPRIAIQEARAEIRKHDAIWRRELINSFGVETLMYLDKWKLRVYNDAEHAPTYEYGAEYDTEGPPIAALIPWVQEKLGAWTLPDDDDGDSAGDDSDEVAGGTPTKLSFRFELSEDSPIDEVLRPRDAGVEGGANVSDTRIIKYADGSKTLYKDGVANQNTVQHVQRNEIIQNEISNELSWSHMPETAIRQSVISESDSPLGTEQAFAEDHVDFHQKVVFDTANTDLTPDEITPAEYLSQNRENHARMTLLDILVDNQDRHGGNIMIDEATDDMLAIDNGGFRNIERDYDADVNLLVFPDAVIGPDKFYRFADRYENPERVRDELVALKEQQQDFIDDLVEIREDIIAQFEYHHGTDHSNTERVKELLENDAETLRIKIDEIWQNTLNAFDDIQGGTKDDSDPDVDSIDASIDSLEMPDTLKDILDDI